MLAPRSILYAALLTAATSPSSGAQEYSVANFHPVDLGPSESAGAAVALDGDYAALGAFPHAHTPNASGAVWLYERESSGWLLAQEVLPADDPAFARFGTSIAIHGERMIVGADRHSLLAPSAGAAYIFERSPLGAWEEVALLTASDGGTSQEFGHSVDIEGDFAVVGTPLAKVAQKNPGAAYVYQRQPDGAWLEVQKILGSGDLHNDEFGNSVSISGTRVAVGAPGEDDFGAASGAAFLFERQNDGSWPEVARLIASDGAGSDSFGYSVALSGEAVVAGAWLDDDVANGTGSAYVFERQADGTWPQTAKLLRPGAISGDHFGQSVAIDGDTILVGALHTIVGFHIFAGSAQLFVRDTAGWSWRREYVHEDPNSHDNFGQSVAIQGGYALLGSTGDDDVANNGGGAYLRFSYDGTGQEPPTFEAVGTPGCDGPQFMGSNLPPLIGTANFALTTGPVPASELGVLLLGSVADITGSDPFNVGIALHVDPLLSAPFYLWTMTSDASGLGSRTLAVPNDPALVGDVLHAQSVWLWSSCSPSASGLSSSNLMTFTIGLP